MILMISNALTPHQIPFCDAMYRYTNEEFIFAEMDGISLERKRMGWTDAERIYLRKYTDFTNKEWLVLVDSADAVILGGTTEKIISKRLKQKKLVLRYSERFYKGDMDLRKWIHAYIGSYLHHKRYQNKNYVLLCASAYTAGDAAVFGNYINRTYKWGYFPEVLKEDIDKLMFIRRSHLKISILWVGRLVGLKHPEDAIAIAERLKEAGYLFELNIIGGGEMEEELRQLVNERKLDGFLNLLGNKKSDIVRDYMRQADIYLFTSDFNEGWGAVLNESMNSGCAVVVSHAIGSVPYLITNKVNGMIYKNGDLDSLFSCVQYLMESSDRREQIGRNAYNTILNEWNGDFAAHRILDLIDSLKLEDFTKLPKTGPCSKAEIIKNGWM